MTGTLRRALRLSAAERRALVVATAAQLACALLLRVVRFRHLCHMGGRAGGHAATSPADLQAVDRALWAMDAAGRHLGRFSSCLARALAAQWMARRAGVSLPVSVGVARGTGGALDAHAWIVGPGGLRLGAAASGRYLPLVVLKDSQA